MTSENLTAKPASAEAVANGEATTFEKMDAAAAYAEGPPADTPPRRHDRMLKWFEYRHLPEHLQGVSQQFYTLASCVVDLIPSGPERTVALRKLLEAKDAAVRAVVHPGG